MHIKYACQEPMSRGMQLHYIPVTAFLRKGILKMDQSVKMGVACSYSSAPDVSQIRFPSEYFVKFRSRECWFKESKEKCHFARYGLQAEPICVSHSPKFSVLLRVPDLMQVYDNPKCHL